MTEKANSGRDAFTFSLQGMTTIAPIIAAPAAADDLLNKAWDERLGRAPGEQPDTARKIENTLARYFAPGCCQGA